VVIISDRFGYLKTLMVGLFFTIVGTWAFLQSDVGWIWITANCLIGITWAYTISYLLGLASRFDVTGQMAAMGGFASKMGLASGPALAAMMLGEDNYVLITWAAVVGLVLCSLAVIYPARMQDRKGSQSP
jgi:MFS family permease